MRRGFDREALLTLLAPSRSDRLCAPTLKLGAPCDTVSGRDRDFSSGCSNEGLQPRCASYEIGRRFDHASAYRPQSDNLCCTGPFTSNFYFIKMIGNFFRAVVRFFGFGSSKVKAKREHRYTLAVFEDRSAAVSAARLPGAAAIVRSGGKHKWLLFTCPCGCQQQIALNLMDGHSPRWRVDVQSPRSFTVHPSIDATACGAHFWLRGGVVIWCD